MVDLQSFLSETSAKMGVSLDSTKSATSVLLGLVGQKAGEDQLAALTDKIPGLTALRRAPQESTRSGGLGGMISGLGQAMTGAPGDKLGGVASLLGAFQDSGLDLNQSGTFVNLFFSFAKSQAGKEIVDRIVGKMPELGKLID